MPHRQQEPRGSRRAHAHDPQRRHDGRPGQRRLQLQPQGRHLDHQGRRRHRGRHPEAVLDAGAEEVKDHGGGFEVITDPPTCSRRAPRCRTPESTTTRPRRSSCRTSRSRSTSRPRARCSSSSTRSKTTTTCRTSIANFEVSADVQARARRRGVGGMALRVLGIDPGLTRCGVGHRGCRRQPRGDPRVCRRHPHPARHAARAAAAGDRARASPTLSTSIEPHAVALERVFAQHNLRTVMGTAQASGVALHVAAARGLAVGLHTPSEVKAAVTGYGAADKKQVGAMVARRSSGSPRCRSPRMPPTRSRWRSATPGEGPRRVGTPPRSPGAGAQAAAARAQQAWRGRGRAKSGSNMTSTADARDRLRARHRARRGRHHRRHRGRGSRAGRAGHPAAGLSLRVGAEAFVRTALIVREDDLSLFGFAEADELDGLRPAAQCDRGRPEERDGRARRADAGRDRAGGRPRRRRRVPQGVRHRPEDREAHRRLARGQARGDRRGSRRARPRRTDASRESVLVGARRARLARARRHPGGRGCDRRRDRTQTATPCPRCCACALANLGPQQFAGSTARDRPAMPIIVRPTPESEDELAFEGALRPEVPRRVRRPGEGARAVAAAAAGGRDAESRRPTTSCWPVLPGSARRRSR